MKKRKENKIDLQLNARGFESFAATGWLGNRSEELATARPTAENNSREEDKSSQGDKKKPFRIA